MSSKARLLVVANRLPVTVEQRGDEFIVRQSDGGLVRALAPVLARRGGAWIGWAGRAADSEVVEAIRRDRTHGIAMVPVEIPARDVRLFYEGCSNEIIWPLFHDLQSRCAFDPAYWEAYCRVNETFADVVEREATAEHMIWVHDYQLMLMAECLRERGIHGRVAYFHHIPFPSPDVFDKLPWRTQLLRALLRFHLVGFQTTKDRRNFISCIRRHLPGASIRRMGDRLLIHAGADTATIGTFPIGIDYDHVAATAAQPSVQRRAEAIRATFPNCRILVGVDRLDYTKGIPERLHAFEQLLADRPELTGRVTFIQVVVPSREQIPEYAELKRAIEQQVANINGRLGAPGWTPVQYLYRNIPEDELVALYRAAHVALVTPIRDGMNLVAKEYCAAQQYGGVLVLSEFAGAAENLGSAALVVNPYDRDGMAEAIHRALLMDRAEQERRMSQLQGTIRSQDVFWWCDRFCAAVSGWAPLPRTLMRPEAVVAAGAA